MNPVLGSALLALVFSTLILSAAPAASAPAPTAPANGGDPVKVWVLLKDKGQAKANAFSQSAQSTESTESAPFSPSSPSSPSPQKARAYENLPLYEPYLEALRAQGFSLDVRLKWQNRVSGRIAADRMDALRRLPFVSDVSMMPRKAPRSRTFPEGRSPWVGMPGLGKRAADAFDYGAGRGLVDSLRVAKLHAWMAASGMPPGRGVRVAVIDGDFHLGSPVFSAMKARIRDQWDFVAGKPGAVTDSLLDSHGAECMSLIGGNLPGTLVGMAPEADFLLYRAEENAQERYVEEDWVAAAIERAVDSGAQVISISLGYRYDYTDGQPELPYKSFNGRTRPSSLAALGAARRNVLVSVSMGNEGDRATKAVPATLSAPADADSILAVGIVDSLRARCGYSSTGPSFDGRVKPDVVSMGIKGCGVIVANPFSPLGAVTRFSGTSFAAPAIAGVAALLRQLAPERSAQEIRRALIETAERYRNPDAQVGYGLVDVSKAARRIGIPVNPPLAQAGLTRLYHAGGTTPMVIDWDPDRLNPALELIDLRGRLIAIKVSKSGSGTQLFVEPEHPLQTGIYIARIR
jgi:serine protease AprX